MARTRTEQTAAGAGLGRSTVRKHRDEAGASAPAPKRRALLGSSSEGTLLVRDTHYQIKGLCSFLHDMQCYICQDWDGEAMWQLKCRNVACSHLGYICATCSRNPEFEMKCSVCRGVAVFMKHDVTATGLMRKIALIECEQPKCPELMTRGTMREHLESSAPSTWKPALSQAATSGTYPSRGLLLCLSPPVFHAYMCKWRRT
jgi:hypothetical protein